MGWLRGGIGGRWGWHRGGVRGTVVALGVGGVQGVAHRWHGGSVGWHTGGNRDLWGDTGVALGAQGWHWGSVGWHRGGIRGTEVVLGVCRVHGVAQKWP